MIRSMTAFARHERQGEWGTLTWELRSINHRYLEVNTRLPESLRALESQVRERAAACVNRGKLECSLRYQPSARLSPAFSINTAWAERLARACHDLEPLLKRPAPVSAMELLRWPGVVQETEQNLEPVHAAALEALGAALDELVQTRSREGTRIRAFIEQRCAAMETHLAETRARLPEVLSQMREKLKLRLAELNAQPDPDRLEQEILLLAQKMDVAEELDRLQSHLEEVRQTLSRAEPVGRRLDFLMQELNREANTLASKSADTTTTLASVELKVLIEQMREQVQNIE